MIDENTCRLCGDTPTISFFKLSDVPTMDGVMAGTKEAAKKFTKGSIDLHFCEKCGYIRNVEHHSSNIDFKEYDYSPGQSPLLSMKKGMANISPEADKKL